MGVQAPRASALANRCSVPPTSKRKGTGHCCAPTWLAPTSSANWITAKNVPGRNPRSAAAEYTRGVREQDAAKKKPRAVEHRGFFLYARTNGRVVAINLNIISPRSAVTMRRHAADRYNPYRIRLLSERFYKALISQSASSLRPAQILRSTLKLLGTRPTSPRRKRMRNLSASELQAVAGGLAVKRPVPVCRPICRPIKVVCKPKRECGGRPVTLQAD